jgi:plastocyanin
MRRLTVIAIVAASAAAAAAVPTVSALASTPTKQIKVGDNFFKPKTVTINRGTRVTWVLHSFGVPHNVTVKSGPSKFHSRELQRSGSYSHLFSKKGTYHLEKISYQMTPGNRLTGFYHWTTDYELRGASKYVPRESMLEKAGPVWMTKGEWQTVRGNTLVASMQYGRWDYTNTYDGMAPGKQSTTDIATLCRELTCSVGVVTLVRLSVLLLPLSLLASRSSVWPDRLPGGVVSMVINWLAVLVSTLPAASTIRA